MKHDENIKNEVNKFYKKIDNEYYYDNENRVYGAMNKEDAYLKNPNKFLEIFNELWDDFYFGETKNET